MATMSDPFLWDVDQVVEALCAPNIPWTKDCSALEAKVREEEIDGKTLLTFEQTCSRQELMECLDIRLARHKSSLAERLVKLRARSHKYKLWHAEFSRDLSLKLDDEPDQSLLAPDRNEGSSRLQSVPPHTEVGNVSPSRRLANAKPTLPTVSDAGQGSFAPQLVRDSPNIPDGVTTGEPPLKKKRIAPTNLSHEPTDRTTPWENQPPWAYLGDGKIPDFLVKSHSGIISTRLINYRNGDYSLGFPNQLPPGRRMAVSRIMRKVMWRNGRKEQLLKNGEPLLRSPTPSDGGGESIALSDLPSEWDEQTRQEIEEEEREKAEEQLLERHLPRDRVQAIINQAIGEMTASWREWKIPKLERKAYRVWAASRRHGTRLRDITKARDNAQKCNGRLQRYSDEILDQKWQKEEDVRHQAQILEQTLEDKLYYLWQITTIESRTEPPKPHMLPRPPKEANTRLRDSMSETLTTSEDEDDFIVPDDDDDEMAVDQPQDMMATPSRPPEDERPDLIDLTQEKKTSWQPSDWEQSNYIDLTTPTKPNSDRRQSQEHPKESPMLEAPPIDSLESWKEIDSYEPGHWAKQNDRWRLTINLLGKLSFGRRAAILDLVKTKAPDLWDQSVGAYLANPPPSLDRLGESEWITVHFDISRIFLAFSKCRNVKEKRMAPPSDRTKAKLSQCREQWFEMFCSFLVQTEPIFPQESQIYRTDALDDALDNELDDIEADMDGPGDERRTPRKNAPREIIRNKDAVDLREREQQRLKDQETRRAKLRAAIATSGQVSQDKSRLIINESKEEDQSLLYVNRDISKSIKDHQVDGVRFLWNQIVVDPDNRQGCLLAHTMGLGKTMQVITFLVAIAEAAASSDSSLRSQIPEDLRRSQTLILCPAGLVDNWMDELLKWAPSGMLGTLRQLDSQAQDQERTSIIKNWAKDGGVLVIGYHMFMKALGIEEVEDVLLTKPSIVVADEAHMLKNPTGVLNRQCSRFTTTSRIALTGSPLANNVEEYHAMIDWVAPNFLGPLLEFREVYVRDIQAGLWSDSLPFEKRKALKVLQVLKETVAPKVNRATIRSCLAHDLPPKSEFVISLQPNELQRTLYELYRNGLGIVRGSSMGRAQLFSIVNDLGLICNHPRCFRQKVLDVKASPEKNQSFCQDIISPALKATNGPNIMEPALSPKVLYLLMILDYARFVGDKVLVFSQSIYTLDYLESLFKIQKRGFCRLDGKTKIQTRQERIRDFNTGDQHVYLISTTAGGVGLNIQGANRVVIFDSKWNPVNDQQAVGRAYRMGQKKKVFVYHLTIAGTFEDVLQSKAVFKTQLASRVVDKKNPIAWGNRLGGFTQPIQEVRSQDLSGFVGKDDILDRLIQNPPDDSLICRIVSTDTFEEEDVDTKLTPEERREADLQIRMNRARQTDPDEYERLKAEQAREQMASVSYSMPHVSAAIPQPTFNVSFTSSNGIPGLSNEFPGALNGIPENSTGVPGPSFPPSPHPIQQPISHSNLDSASDSHGRERPRSTDANDAGEAPKTQGPGQEPEHRVSSSAPTPQSRIPYPSSHNESSRNAITAPAPITGANTFFSQPERFRKVTSPEASSSTEKTQEKTPTAARGGLFSQPQSPEKNKFERKVGAFVQAAQDTGRLSRVGVAGNIATALTNSVDYVRKQMSMGFLPDNQHWRNLGELLDYERFALATLTGCLSPKFLAHADKSELQRKVEMLSKLSDEEFMAKITNAATKLPDPENLQNIRRFHRQGEGSPRAKADMKAMRETADNRTQRKPFRLPEWARRDLHVETERARASEAILDANGHNPGSGGSANGTG